MSKPISQLNINQLIKFFQKFEVGKKADCWPWKGAKDPDGYGVHGLANGTKNVTYRANRVSYRIFYGKDPGDKFVCHHCDNPACVNPIHLFVGSPRDNNLDKKEKGRSYRPMGSKHGLAKLTEADVTLIRKLNKLGYTHETIAKKFNIGFQTVGAIVTYRRWTHI